MRWAYPGYLWLLLVLPLMAAYLVWLREGDLPRLRLSSFRRLKGTLAGGRNQTGVLPVGVLRILALLLFVLALARPQKGLKSEELTTKATDIMICLDASRSMLVMDFKPDNRFQVAKNVISEFIKGREYDRIGLVLFGEYAVTQCPLTVDRSALLNILDNLEVGVISPDQTAIGTGIATSINRLKNSAAKSKVIVLLTDGSNNAGSIDPLTAAKTATAYGIKIYAIGAGTPEGGLMPVDHPLMGRQMVPIKADLDEDTLIKVSGLTDGKYFRAKSEGALKTIFHEIDSLEKTDIKLKEYVDYQELYVWLIIAGFFFLLSELFLSKTVFRTLP